MIPRLWRRAAHGLAARLRRLAGYLPAVAALTAGVAAVATLGAQSSGDKWWPGYSGGADNSRYFASRQINKANVSRLQVAWTYPYGDTSFNPIAVRGAIYGRGRNGSLVAVDAKTGRELWVRENMNGMTARGMNYWESADGRDQRLIFAMNSLLQQLDAKTGKPVMSFGTNGVVDLRVGIDGRDPATIGNIQSNWPGEVFENLIILGSATGEGYMSPPGDIRAYDVLTGRLVWTFHTVPRPGEFGYDTWPKDAWKYIGGVNNWGEMTVDARRGIVYIPLGSPTYDFYGADRPGANLFGTSIVALEARTGKRLWHFQIVHHDLWDLDPSAAPQLIDHPPQRAQPGRRRGGEQDHVALRVRPRDRRTDLADRGTSGAEVRHAGRRELADAAAIRPTRRRSDGSRSASTTSVPICRPTRPTAFRKRLLARQEPGPLHADQLRRHGAHPDEQRRRALRRHGGRTRTRRRLRRRARQPRHPAPAAPGRERRPRRRAAGAARAGRLSAELPDAATVRIGWARRTACRCCTPPRIRRTTSPPARRASTRPRSARSSAPAKDGCLRSRI